MSNSSMRQMPLSASTRAPASSVHSRETGLRWTYAVRPTADAPCPVVNTTRDAVFSTYLRNCDLAVPGSPQTSTLMSPRTLCLPPTTRNNNSLHSSHIVYSCLCNCNSLTSSWMHLASLIVNFCYLCFLPAESNMTYNCCYHYQFTTFIYVPENG